MFKTNAPRIENWLQPLAKFTHYNGIGIASIYLVYMFAKTLQYYLIFIVVCCILSMLNLAAWCICNPRQCWILKFKGKRISAISLQQIEGGTKYRWTWRVKTLSTLFVLFCTCRLKHLGSQHGREEQHPDKCEEATASDAHHPWA